MPLSCMSGAFTGQYICIFTGQQPVKMSKYITCTECSLVLIMLTDATSHGFFFWQSMIIFQTPVPVVICFGFFQIWFFPKVPSKYIQSPTE